MTRAILSVALLIAALALSLPAQAASLTRTFVSGAGNDSNPCTVTAPCRTFAGAYANTAANGIIAVLDPAGYGALNITGPVTIDGNGWAAITTPNNGAGITINAGSSDNVVLRGLTIDGGGAANNRGIQVGSVGSLVVDGTVVRGTGDEGLDFRPSGTATLAVSNSAFNVTGDIGMNIQNVFSSSNAITAAIDRTQFIGNVAAGLIVSGIRGTGAINVTVTDSVAAGNGAVGFYVQSDAGQSATTLALTHVQSAGNGSGVYASGANATLTLAQSTFTGNTNGAFTITGGGVINTFGDNYFADNGSNSGSLTPVSKQ